MSLRSPIIDEPERLRSVERLEIMDTPTEPEFDELVELAAAICEVPISLLSFIDDKRQWYKAAIGLLETERALELTFCQYSIGQDDLLVIEDTQQDDLFVSHPAVTGDPSVRFYAGIPIRTPDGYPVGTLCVADLVPRHMSEVQIKTLKVLAQQANARLELRDQRKRMERALFEAEQSKALLAVSDARFKIFMDSAPFMSYLKDQEGRFLFYNRALCNHFSISPTEWIGRTDAQTSPAEFAEVYRQTDLAVLASGTLQIVEEISKPEDSPPTYWRSYKFPCTDGDATLLGGFSIDLTQEIKQGRELAAYQRELEEANTKLRALATTDPLTGLPNRRAFDDRFASEFAQARRKARNLSVVMLDVDNFKQLNDQYGHDEGDTCLKQIATLLSGLLRENDMMARYGGEEFVLLLPETDESQASQLGHRMLDAMRSATWKCSPMTISGGIASLDSNTVDQRHLISLADEALYAAKYGGKDQLHRSSSLFEEMT